MQITLFENSKILQIIRLHVGQLVRCAHWIPVVRGGQSDRAHRHSRALDRQDRFPAGVATKAKPSKGGDAKLQGYSA